MSKSNFEISVIKIRDSIISGRFPSSIILCKRSYIHITYTIDAFFVSKMCVSRKYSEHFSRIFEDCAYFEIPYWEGSRLRVRDSFPIVIRTHILIIEKKMRIDNTRKWRAHEHLSEPIDLLLIESIWLSFVYDSIFIPLSVPIEDDMSISSDVTMVVEMLDSPESADNLSIEVDEIVIARDMENWLSEAFEDFHSLGILESISFE